MPLWRCPYCGTPQVESSRCWVCRRSTTSCAACRHFRRGVAAGLGLCGLDPRHVALRGTEMRACWEAADTTGTMGPPEDAVSALEPVTAASVPVGHRTVRTFVPVESLATRLEGAGRSSGAETLVRPNPGTEFAPEDHLRIPSPAMTIRRVPGGWSLWGDFEP